MKLQISISRSVPVSVKRFTRESLVEDMNNTLMPVKDKDKGYLKTGKVYNRNTGDFEAVVYYSKQPDMYDLQNKLKGQFPYSSTIGQMLDKLNKLNRTQFKIDNRTFIAEMSDK